jgi:tRNA threonylcarbamoyladenosine biosynthesis protein TsaB
VLILALDTATRVGSLALIDDDRVVIEGEGDARFTHGTRLPGDIVRLLDQTAFGLGDVDVFAVNAGPGSFTGLRVGIATIQGLALVSRRPVVAISGFEALAHLAIDAAPHMSDGDLMGVWIDAQRDEVFASLFRCSQLRSPSRLEAVEPPSAGHPDGILSRWSRHLGRGGAWFAGDGATRYGRVVTSVTGARLLDRLPPTARGVAALALDRARRGDVISPHAIQPIYVRRPDAEIAREAARPDPIPEP